MGRKMLLGAAMAGTLTLTASAMAQEPGPPPGPSRDGRPGFGIPPNLERVLALTEEQRSAVRQLRSEQREAMRPLLEEQHRLGRQLHEALAADKPDPLAVGQAAIAQHAARERLKPLAEGFHKRLLELLDDEQRQKLEDLSELAGPGAGPRGGRPGSPPRPR
jgi:Spy/CpxP family protein refolding chaperone